MSKTSSSRTYTLYESFKGGATPHWQYWNEPKVYGCECYNGRLYPPDPATWTVRATSIQQACFFANTSVSSSDRSDGLGVWEYGREQTQ